MSEKCVVRGITTMHVHGFLIKVENGQVSQEEHIISIPLIKDEKKLEKEVKKLVPEGYTFVKSKIENETIRYAMPISEFMANAKVIREEEIENETLKNDDEEISL